MYSRKESPHGNSWEKWVEIWWKWCYSDPNGHNPIEDPTGELCANSQKNEEVWFLCGTFGGMVERTCHIPYGRTIFVPILNDIVSFQTDPQLKTERELHSYAKSDLDKTLLLWAKLDDVEIKNLESFRVHSYLFEISLPGVNSRLKNTTSAVSDGFWLFFKHLTKGNHVLEFVGKKLEFDRLINTSEVSMSNAPKFRVEVRYNLEIS